MYIKARNVFLKHSSALRAAGLSENQDVETETSLFSRVQSREREMFN